MIARIWHGVVKKQRSDEYLKLMQTVAIPDYRSVPGNLAAYVLRKEDGDFAHFLTLTFWESLEAISAFAGDEASRAKYYDFDAEFLLELEPTATHYELYPAAD